MTRSGTDSPRGPHSAGSLSPSPSDAVLDQRLVGVHAHVGVDVVALGLADQRIQARPGVVAGPQQRLQAVDQGVFVGAVQRVAGLEGDDPLPALLGQQLADLARREHVFAEARVLRLRQDLDRAAQQMRLVGVGLQAPCRRRDGRSDRSDRRALRYFFLSHGIDVGDVQHGDDLAGRVDQRRPVGPAEAAWPAPRSRAGPAGSSRRRACRCVR